MLHRKPINNYLFFKITGGFLCNKETFHSLLTNERIYGLIIKEIFLEDDIMERIKTLETKNLCESAKNGGCGECQTSCQSACKTSCGVANQPCENTRQ